MLRAQSKFQIMRANRGRMMRSQFRAEVRQAGWDYLGDPELDAVQDEMMLQREEQLQQALERKRWRLLSLPWPSPWATLVRASGLRS